MNIVGAVIAAIALGLIVTPSAARAESAAPAAITVTGQGEISRAPDLATVSVTIVTNDDAVGRALAENNRRFTNLGAKLAALGITGSDIVSTSLSSNFTPHPTDRVAAGPGQFYGYVVTRNVEIKARSVDGAGAVVDAATAAGAGQINGVSYGLRDRRATERAALAAAVADAAAQAQALASAAHVSIVRVLKIESEPGNGRVGPLMMMRAAPVAAAPTTIDPTDLTISAAVTITYAIR